VSGTNWWLPFSRGAAASTLRSSEDASCHELTFPTAIECVCTVSSADRVGSCALPVRIRAAHVRDRKSKLKIMVLFLVMKWREEKVVNRAPTTKVVRRLKACVWQKRRYLLSKSKGVHGRRRGICFCKRKIENCNGSGGCIVLDNLLSSTSSTCIVHREPRAIFTSIVQVVQPTTMNCCRGPVFHPDTCIKWNKLYQRNDRTQRVDFPSRRWQKKPHTQKLRSKSLPLLNQTSFSNLSLFDLSLCPIMKLPLRPKFQMSSSWASEWAYLVLQERFSYVQCHSSSESQDVKRTYFFKIITEWSWENENSRT
jgi:hypothetical protein